ncbi:MAG: STAS domain-containing protein [Pseudonocardia sp.]|nr:STAS domain-containing protein [Pseudonocardia sp.]
MSTPAQHGRRLNEWVRAAVTRGERVLCKHAPTDAALTQLTAWLTPTDPATTSPDGQPRPGQVQFLDAAELFTATDGHHEALRKLHVELIDRARDEGFTGLASTSDEAATRAATADLEQLRAHERDLDQLTRELPLRALCRYPDHMAPALRDEMLAVHHRAVTGQLWHATVADDAIWVGGELDLSNTDRLLATLYAATTAGIRCIDVSEVRFCSVSGVRALIAVADTLVTHDTRLQLRHPPPPMARVLALLRLTDFTDSPAFDMISR